MIDFSFRPYFGRVAISVNPIGHEGLFINISLRLLKDRLMSRDLKCEYIYLLDNFYE